MKNTYRIASFLTLLVLTCPMLLMAAGPGFGGAVDDGGASCTVPLDGGMSLLIAAGVGYGVKKYSKRRKKSVHEEA
jgi:hypothetical protein